MKNKRTKKLEESKGEDVIVDRERLQGGKGEG